MLSAPQTTTTTTFHHRAMDRDHELLLYKAQVRHLTQELTQSINAHDQCQAELAEARATVANLTAQCQDLERRRAGEAARLQRDVEQLGERLIDEAEKRSEIDHAKVLVEAELEDLTRTLFEEANDMVANERRAYAELQREFNRLKFDHEALLAQTKAAADEAREDGDDNPAHHHHPIALTQSHPALTSSDTCSQPADPPSPSQPKQHRRFSERLWLRAKVYF